MSGIARVRAVFDAIDAGGVFRFCLDLNVWYSAMLARTRNRSGTVALALTDFASRGWSGFGPTQVVMSWGMLNELGDVINREEGRTGLRIVQALRDLLLVCQAGAEKLDPLIVLGGRGVVALRDEEDADVLEAAIAGRAHLLVTYNFADFVNYRTEVVKRGRIAVHRTADHELIIAHPAEALPWVQTGRIEIG